MGCPSRWLKPCIRLHAVLVVACRYTNSTQGSPDPRIPDTYPPNSKKKWGSWTPNLPIETSPQCWKMTCWTIRSNRGLLLAGSIIHTQKMLLSDKKSTCTFSLGGGYWPNGLWTTWAITKEGQREGKQDKRKICERRRGGRTSINCQGLERIE